jgi:hypothetical protein
MLYESAELTMMAFIPFFIDTQDGFILLVCKITGNVFDHALPWIELNPTNYKPILNNNIPFLSNISMLKSLTLTFNFVMGRTFLNGYLLT